MGTDRGRSFDRKLEDVLVARLKAGQLPENLLQDLKARFGEAEADAILSRAEARLRPLPPPSLALRILVGLAYAWSVVLMLQSVGILTAVWGALQYDPSIAPFVGFTLLKIGLLCAGIAAYKWRRSPVTTGFYALAILYAFPLGLFIDPRFGSYASIPPSPPELLVSVSALGSYLAVGLITFVWWQGRKAAQSPPETAVFD